MSTLRCVLGAILMIVTGSAIAQDVGCLDAMTELKGVAACVVSDWQSTATTIAEEERRIVSEFDGADAPAKDAALAEFDRSRRSWDEYASTRCNFEIMAYLTRQPRDRRADDAVQVQAQRVFYHCWKTVREDRLVELRRM
jgi:hypothetical protein